MPLWTLLKDFLLLLQRGSYVCCPLFFLLSQSLTTPVQQTNISTTKTLQAMPRPNTAPHIHTAHEAQKSQSNQANLPRSSTVLISPALPEALLLCSPLCRARSYRRRRCEGERTVCWPETTASSRLLSSEAANSDRGKGQT